MLPLEREAFADWLARLMNEQDLGPSRLARMSGVSHSAIVNWIRHDANQAADSVISVANALGVSPAVALQISGRQMGLDMPEAMAAEQARYVGKLPHPGVLAQLSDEDLAFVAIVIDGLLKLRGK